MINFFDLKDEDLIVLNPYNFEESLKRLENLTKEEVRDDLKYIQKKEFYFRNYEEESVYSLDNVQFITSSKNNDNEYDFYLLNDLSKYLISDELLEKIKKDKDKDKEEKRKKIYLEIKNHENGRKTLFVKCDIDPKKFPENIINNFIDKSTFKTAKNVKEDFLKNLGNINEDYYFRFTIVIDTISLNKIYYNKNKGEYFFDFQSPPIFRTNYFISNEEKEEKDKKIKKDENSLFPFRNFEDEISNLRYRHFILKIKKDLNNETTPQSENEGNNDANFDTNDELNNTLENLFKYRNGETDSNKYINKDIQLKDEDKNMKNISYFFKYNNNKNIHKKLEDLFFLKKNEQNDDDEEEEKEEYNDIETIQLFYQVLAFISECILSYYNAINFLDNLLLKGKYRNDIFRDCTNEEFPKYFNITLTKILDKEQNSLKEKSLEEFEEEMKNTFEALYARGESEGLEKILKPSKNEILIRVQRCVITPTYILFTPYVLDQGNRILRDFVDSANYSMLCTFKMDNLEESRWNNKLLIEYIKFIMSKGFFIGEKNFRFFNYSQSQFRNLSCWLLTDPEKILSEIGDFSKIKQVSKFAARISQTLTTTIKTIPIPKDKIVEINDVERNGYTFSDGVGRISVILSEQISKMMKLDYIPSCFQGRFRGCKGVWTTMWDDKTGQIYCRKSQIKFIAYSKDKKDKNKEIENYYFELCDYSRYIQSYLNRQIIVLLSALGISGDKFEKKLFEYKRKLNDEKFVLSLIHYSEWNQMFQKMNSCGINRINDRLSRSIIESNLDILYNDLKKKARIYVEESAYVIGIMDEYGILEYGEAYLQVKRDNFSIILDKKCTVAKCPCLHPGDIRVLNFRKYNRNNIATKKYEIFDKYENVIIFPSKGKRPHPDECSGSDLDGDNYFVFYDSDLIPKKTVEPMTYAIKKNEKGEEPKNFKINDVIEYFAEYTYLNSLGLIGDAHLAISDKEGANCEKALKLAEKFSKAVDAPKTGEKVTLEKDEIPKEFPHFMEKSKNKTYQSKSILGKLYDKSCEFISKRIKLKELENSFYDKDLEIKGWEKYAFLALIYYRDYFYDFVNLLTKNEINGESVLLTGNNIDNENSILSKKKHNYDLREKIGNDIHNLFIQNKKSFYEAITDNFCEINKDKLEKRDFINNELFYINNLNLFASACYMVSYNILESVLNKKVKGDSSVKYYCDLFEEIINDNLIMDNNYQQLEQISEYESMNIGVECYESYEGVYDSLYDKINEEKKIIKNIINGKRKDMLEFEKRISKLPIKYEENKYRILSFPWCISGIVLTNIKFLQYSDEEE